MPPTDHDHPVNPERVTAARAGVLSDDDAGRLAGLLGMLADPVRSRILFALVRRRGTVRGRPGAGPGRHRGPGVLCAEDAAAGRDWSSFRKDGRMVFYRLSDGFPHPLLEHCLRQLLTIAAPEADR